MANHGAVPSKKNCYKIYFYYLRKCGQVFDRTKNSEPFLWGRFFGPRFSLIVDINLLKKLIKAGRQTLPGF